MTKIKELFNKENIMYTIMFLVVFAIIVVNRAIIGFSGWLWITDLASIFYMMFQIATAKHKASMHILNIITNVFLGTSAILQNVYFLAVVCFCISIPLRVVGIINWNKNKNKKTEGELNINKLPKKWLVLGAVLSVVLIAVSMFILWKLDSNLFYLDAVTQGLCIVGLILSANMYIEQFYFFIVGGVTGIVMYVLLTIQALDNLPLVIINVIVTALAVVAYFNWRKKLASSKKLSE